MRRKAGRLRLYWLGHPRVERDGTAVRLDTRKTTALLAFLTLRDQPVSRERLAALLWPELDQQRAPANLRHSLAALRAALPGEWLSAERDRVGVNLSELWIDVRRARTLASEVKAHTHGPDDACPSCTECLREAASLHSGEFLEGFTLPGCSELDDWQVAERESLRSELGWTLERLARAEAAGKHRDRALQAARRWVTLDRLHEPSQAMLIRLLAQSGQRSAAVRQYEMFAALLKSELGTEPDPRTRKQCDAPAPAALYQAVIARPTAPEEGTGSAGTPAATREAGPFASLLRTRLEAPRVRPNAVGRERLVEAIDRAAAAGLAVVCAPAGFGKTTLLSAWASRAGMPVAWLSLDAADNDAHRFLLYCAAALERVRDGMGRAAADLLEAMPPARAPVVMTALSNAAGAAGIDFAFVLDDYQFIQNIEIHEALRFLVDHRPVTMRLLIATREDPPLPVARLRSQGVLGEVRADELRFTSPEAALFLDSMSLSLSERNVAELSRRTEGWIAGLQMAALSLRGRTDADAFIASFGGTNRFILDYLAEEVFARLDTETRDFLLETAFLDRMNAGLCESVGARPGAQAMLEALDRANLFLVALDDRRCWFRYHHLFADLLRHWLQRDRTAAEISALRIRAGDWLGANAMLDEAIPHYLAGGGFDRAADLIERSYVEILSRGGLAQLVRWCREVPGDVTGQRPALGIVAAWAQAWAGKGEEAEKTLQSVERAMGRPDTRQGGTEDAGAPADALRGNISIIRALLNDFAGNESRAVELARAADRLLPADHLMGRAIVFYILGRAAKYRGDLEAADASFTGFLRFSETWDNIWGMSGAVFELVVLYRLMGRLDRCAALLCEFDRQVARHRAEDSSPLSKTFAIAGEMEREHGRLKAAVSIIGPAVTRVEQWGLPVDVYTCLFYFARALRSLGRTEEAEAALDRAGILLETSLVFPSLRPSLEAEKVKTWLAAGNLTSARAWARGKQLDPIQSPLNRFVELTSLVRVRLAGAASNEELDESLAMLEDLVATARHGSWNGLLIEVLLLDAKARLRRRGPGDALSVLAEAIEFSFRGGFLQTVVEEGPLVAELIRAGLEAGKWPDPPLNAYVKTVLASSPSAPTISW